MKGRLPLTSQPPPCRSRFAVRDLVEDVCQEVAEKRLGGQIKSNVDIPAQLQVTADRHMIRRALMNLILNALEAMSWDGELTITGLDDGKGLILEIADSGPGLSDEARRRAFEPFFTTNGAGRGLGLAIVNHVAQAHGGDVSATNCAEGGAAFTIRIPHLSMEAAA